MALPCGMVYVALFGAIAMQSESLVVLYDSIWVRNRSLDEQCSVHQFISHNSYSKPNQKAIPYVAVCIGCLFILRGLGFIFPVEYEFVYSRKSKLSLTFIL
jgi:hypothetical protein